MKLNLITLATVKTQLGISDTSYDSEITAMIPIVSNDVRRILNTNFDVCDYAIITNGSSEITLNKSFNLGQVLSNTNIPDDTYLISYDPDSDVYTMSANATGSDDYVYPTIQIGQWSAISKMIFYKIGKQSTDAASQEKLKSIRYGNVAKTFSDSEINKRFDYPSIFINDLGRPFVRAE